MKIGIEAQRIFRKKKHGMDFVALELIKNLPPSDEHEYIVFVNANADQVDHHLLKHVKVVACKLPYPIWEQFWLPMQIRMFKLDVIHCTANTFPLFSRAPIYLTLHDVIFMESNPLKNKGYTWYQKLGNAYRRWLVSFGLNKVQKLITVSDYEKENIQQRLKYQSELLDIERIYNGSGVHFDASPLTRKRENCLKKKYGLPNDYVLFLGNTDPKKNTPNTLKAFVRFAKSNKEAHLVVGDLSNGFLNNSLPRDTPQEIRDRIVPVGYIENTDLPGLLKMARCFLYPSKRESFGIPLLEAMKCGVPVMTSTTSSLPEIAKDAALKVDPDNITAMSEGINALWNNQELSEAFRIKGIQRSKSFSWSKMTLEYVNVYQQVA